MNKTIIININSIVFHIEEDAYEVLRSYMIEIKRHFSQSDDSGEILQDIENRIAEMFTERIQAGKKEVISMLDVNEVIGQMGRVSDFEQADEMKDEPYVDESKEDYKRVISEKKLMRNPDDKVVAGVCSGLGYYFGMQAKWIRVLFILFFLFGGSGVLLYVILWIVMPEAITRADRMSMRGEEPNLQNFKKNFEEELEGYKDDFSAVRGHLSNGGRTVGKGISTFFQILGKGFAFLMLVFCGMVIIGMLITFVGFATGILGYQDEMVFPGLRLLSTGQAFIALLAGVMAITIPFIALLHIFLRMLLKTRSMNTYLSLSLWAGWIVSVILIIFYSFVGIQEYKESSTIKVEKVLEKQNVYHFEEKDIRVIEAAALDNGDKKYTMTVKKKELSRYLRNEINIRFEYIDSLDIPYIQYNYVAKGRTYQSASERASHIDYLAKQDKGKIVFDSHFALTTEEPYRDEAVSVVVFLPEGAKVTIDQTIRSKMWNLPYSDCKKEYGKDETIKYTEWVMRRSGLQCAPLHIEKTKKKEKKVKDATISDDESSY
ncbi:MAG: PspC domain-containing protein [Sphingobacterium sp.]|jgi:phage shock protein PspC (stress-responsive transcriptional regulator)|nr:PspC domain-containing protein [Sphingobacterium sp.]